jgi:hypothetical protein
MRFGSRCALTMALVLGALVIAPQPIRADQPTRISGTVFVPDGTPLAGASISARFSDGTEALVRADAHGRFAITGFHLGPAELTVTPTPWTSCACAPCITSSEQTSGDDIDVIFHPIELHIFMVNGQRVQAGAYRCPVVVTHREVYDRHVI